MDGGIEDNYIEDLTKAYVDDQLVIISQKYRENLENLQAGGRKKVTENTTTGN